MVTENRVEKFFEGAGITLEEFRPQEGILVLTKGNERLEVYADYKQRPVLSLAWYRLERR